VDSPHAPRGTTFAVDHLVPAESQPPQPLGAALLACVRGGAGYIIEIRPGRMEFHTLKGRGAMGVQWGLTPDTEPFPGSNYFIKG